MSMVHFRKWNKIAIVCDSCMDDVTSQCSIRCQNCKEDECYRCFVRSCLASLHDSHMFRVIKGIKSRDSGGKIWTILNEFIFFKGLKLYGIGNWKDISSLLPGASPSDVEDHFNKLFKIDPIYPPADPSIARVSNPNSHTVWCYMPFRMDFETHYKEEREEVIKDLKIDESDPDDLRIKLQIFETYKSVLILRAYREAFMIRRGIVNMKRLMAKEDSYDKIKLGVLERFKPLALFLSKNDFNTLFEGMLSEAKLKEMLDGNAPVLQSVEHEFCKEMGLSAEVFNSLKKYIIKRRVSGRRIDVGKLKVIVGENNKDVEAIYKYFLMGLAPDKYQ